MLQRENDRAVAMGDRLLPDQIRGPWVAAHLSGAAGGLLTACLNFYSQDVGTGKRAMEAWNHVTA